jgi:hypothetical protein
MSCFSTDSIYLLRHVSQRLIRLPMPVGKKSVSNPINQERTLWWTSCSDVTCPPERWCFLRGPKRWWSAGAKSGMWGGCGRVSFLPYALHASSISSFLILIILGLKILILKKNGWSEKCRVFQNQELRDSPIAHTFLGILISGSLQWLWHMTRTGERVMDTKSWCGERI